MSVIMRISFHCQPFCRDFILSSSSSLFLLCKFFQCQKQPLFIFVSTMEEGFRLLLVLLHKKKKKTKKEQLRSFRVFCSAFLSVEDDMVKDKWRIYANKKSFPSPSAKRAMASANRMWGKKRVQSKQTQSS